jgi:hypothetical protein
MATATPSPTPNPDATKYTLDVTFDEMVTFSDAEAAAGDPFAAAVFAAPGVASLFATANFVTVTRAPGADWEPITAAVQAAAAEHL